MTAPQPADVIEQTARSAPTKLTGALGGGLTVLGFVVLHDLWISDIWFNVVPMVLSGAVCGVSIVWSYQATTTEHSWARWFGYNGVCGLLLIALGAASFLVLEPRFTMAEMMNADDALARLLPPAMPLIVAGTLVGTLVLWLGFGRRGRAVLPMLVTQALLMFLVGHNVAILGLVDIPTDQLYRVLEFIGVTVFLAAAFALSVMVLGRIIGSRRMQAE
jgi:hypothetical protein